MGVGCATTILKAPPRRVPVPVIHQNALLAPILWTAGGLAVGALVGLPGWFLGLPFLDLLAAGAGGFAGMVISQLTVMSLTPTKAAQRKARWEARTKAHQDADGTRAAVYAGCAGPLRTSYQRGIPIQVRAGCIWLPEPPTRWHPARARLDPPAFDGIDDAV
jgi:hypothetical protein